MIKRIQIRINGRVQGVYFRKGAQQKARELMLKGFVRNEADGSVYIEAEGAEDKLNEMAEWCHNGPPIAMVAQVMVNEVPIRAENDFEIH
jgi:acylphosphatase